MRWRGEELARPPWAVACGGTWRPGRGGEVHGVESTAFLGSHRRRLDRVCFGFVMICLPPSMESKLWRRCVDSFAERARGTGSYGGATRVHRPGARGEVHVERPIKTKTNIINPSQLAIKHFILIKSYIEKR
jgi:hypothetical protein